MERRMSIMLLAVLTMLIVSAVDGCVNIGISNGAGGNGNGYCGQFELGKGVGLSTHLSSDDNNLMGKSVFSGTGVINAGETHKNNCGSVTLVAYGYLEPGYKYSSDGLGVGKDNEDVWGWQSLTRDGAKSDGAKNLNFKVLVEDKDGLKASVAAGMGQGDIQNLYQKGVASQNGGVDAWQNIDSADGSNIWLTADASDKCGRNRAYSSVTLDQGTLTNYNSEATGNYLDPDKKQVDLSAANGPFNAGPDTQNDIGTISGRGIHSEGLTYNQNGYSAFYGVNIDRGTISGRFDMGTETKSNGWMISNGGVIAVPLESPTAWGGYADPTVPITISTASNLCSYSMALKGKDIVSMNMAYAKRVNSKEFYLGPPGSAYPSYPFAGPSIGGVDPTP